MGLLERRLYIMRNVTRALSALLLMMNLLFLSPLCDAEPEFYGDIALGLSVHVLTDDSDELNEGTDGAASQLLKGALGIQWTSFFSTQLGVFYWSDDISEVDTTSSEDEAEPVTFQGVSASWEAALRIPLSRTKSRFSYGPYYRYGQHCWSAVFSGLAQPWSKEGCSEIQSAGFSFPSARGYEVDAQVYIEFTHTDFEDVSSRSLLAGVRMPI